MYNGLDVEIGYLPVLIDRPQPNIQPGKPGNFDGSHFITALEKPVSVDRSMGDVHPLGNPHYHYSPTAFFLWRGDVGALSCSTVPPMRTKANLSVPGKVRRNRRGGACPKSRRCRLPVFGIRRFQFRYGTRPARDPAFRFYIEH
jgi:hypothetical protein